MEKMGQEISLMVAGEEKLIVKVVHFNLLDKLEEIGMYIV